MFNRYTEEYEREIFEDENILITYTGFDYDFIGVVENKTEEDIVIELEGDEPFTVPAGDWIGILADSEGYTTMSKLRAVFQDVEGKKAFKELKKQFATA